MKWYHSGPVFFLNSLWFAEEWEHSKSDISWREPNICRSDYSVLCNGLQKQVS